MMWIRSRPLLILFSVGFLVRLLFFAIFAVHVGTPNFILPGGDAYHYLVIGQNLAHGHGYSQALEAPFLPNSDRSPVVPFLIALITGWLRLPLAVYLLVQVLASTATVAVLYLLGKLVFPERVAFLAALLYAFDPLVAFNSILLLTETWFALFFLLSVLALTRFWQDKQMRFAGLSGAILGLATLTRAVSVLYPIVAILAIAFLTRESWTKKLAGIVIFTTVFGLVLSPWVIRNYKTFGAVSFSPVPAYNWYWYNAREFYTVKHNLSEAAGKALFSQWREQAIQANPELKNEMRLQSFYLRQAWTVIREDFPVYFKFHTINTLAVYLNSGWDDLRQAWSKGEEDVNFTALLTSGWTGVIVAVKQYPMAILSKFLLGLFYVVIAVGWFVTWRRQKDFLFFTFLLITVLFFGITTGATAEPRFRVAAEPMLWLLFVSSAKLIFQRFFPIFKNSSSSTSR